MFRSPTKPILAQAFSPVKPCLNSQLPLFPDTVIHHKVSVSKNDKMIVSYSRYNCKPYGVSSVSKALPVSLFRKKYEYIQRCLKLLVGLTDCEVEAVMRLLRIETYYGNTYPKASQIAPNPKKRSTGPFIPYPGYIPPQRHSWGTSRASFWRAIRRLKELGLITVVNRYVLRPHAQISNLYKLDKLVVMIVKYLAEHTGRIWPDWVGPYLGFTWPELWKAITTGSLKLPSPLPA